ncbi:MAG: ArsA-related P-loop ATPase [bacterium]
MDLRGLIEKKKILICCGSGGVGKTTIAAALGVQGAVSGQTVLALTIDPARRLANSLGLSYIGNTETLVSPDKFRESGPAPKGALYAMMLDTKHAFDEVIERYAPSAEVKRNILQNRFYQNLSAAMAGSHEYLAVEKLYQIFLRGRYDLILLDTPPTRHALDFLEAPNRVRAFFDRSVSTWFLKPYFKMGRMGLQLFNRTAGTFFKMLERVTGAEFLRDVSELMAGLADAFDIFRSRADEVMHVLHGEATSFLLVTGTSPAALDEATFFYRRLRQAGLPLGGCIVNRVHERPDSAEISTDGALQSDAAPRDLLRYLEEERNMSRAMALRLVENYSRYLRLWRKDEEVVRRFAKQFSGNTPVHTVPMFDRDIFDLPGLFRINAHLFRG